MSKFSQIIKEKNFFFLWIGQVISQFGDRLNQMALIGLISQKAPGSTLQLAKLLFFVILPVFIIGPVAGVYIDRWNRKRTMITCDIIRGILVCLIPLVALYSNQMLPVYLVVFVVFSITRFYVPSKLAIIPNIVSSDRLLIANSLVSTTGMVAAIIGFSFGGVLISMSRIGVNGGFYIDGASYFLSAITVALLTINHSSGGIREDLVIITRGIKDAIKKSMVSQLKEGLREVIFNRQTRSIIGILFLLWSGVGSIYVVIIVFIQQSLGSITRDLGLVVAFFAAGLFLGSLIYGRFGQKIAKDKIMSLSLLSGGLMLTVFVILVKTFPWFFIAAALACLFGISISPIMVSSNTLIHEIIPEDMRGRIFSSLEFVMHLAFLIFMLFTSYIAEFIDRMWVLVFFGILFFIVGLFGFLKGFKLKVP